MNDITELSIYWITRLDSLRGMAITIMSLSAITFIISGIIYVGNKVDGTGADKQFNTLMSFIGKSALTFFATLLTLTFIPSTAEMCAIKVIPALSRSEWLSDGSKRLLDIANAYMEKQIKVLENDVQK